MDKIPQPAPRCPRCRGRWSYDSVDNEFQCINCGYRWWPGREDRGALPALRTICVLCNKTQEYAQQPCCRSCAFIDRKARRPMSAKSTPPR